MADVAIAAQQALSGERRGLRAVVPFLGPAFIASVAYVDPGNFATNVAAGAQFGYALGWVVLAGLATFIVLAMEVGGFRRLEAAITALVGLVVLAFCLEILMSRPSPSAVASGAFEPRLPGGAALLAVSIVGATVMPHVIYLHSALVRGRVDSATPAKRRRVFRFEIVDVVCAMGLAGLINLAMLATAAAVFFTRGDTSAGGNLGRVVTGLDSFVGMHSGTVFGVALLISGIASSSVGTMSGQVVMEGFLHRRIPLFLRRAVTMIPALVVLAIGVNPTRALVLSQVFLSFGIPFALVPLVVFTARRSIMGALVNRRLTTVAAIAVSAVIVGLNGYLLCS